MQPRTTLRNSLILLSSLALAASSHALDFTATFDPSATPQERAAIQGAMADWSSRITSSAHLNVAFVPDPTLGNTGNSYFQSDGDLVPYATYKTALAAHAGSALDATAVGYLQSTTGGSFGYLINNTNQAGGDEHASSSGAVDMTSALEKALGIVPSDTSDPDFTVYYNPDASRYDYDRSDGISAGLRDFGGTIRCQIGQGMGFFSEVDDLDSPDGAGYDDAFGSDHETAHLQYQLPIQG